MEEKGSFILHDISLTFTYSMPFLERMLAAQNPLTQMDRPHQLFADAPPTQPQMPPTMPPAFMAPMPPMGRFF